MIFEKPFQAALAGEHWEGTLMAIASDGGIFKVQAALGTDRSDTEPVGVVCAFLRYGEKVSRGGDNHQSNTGDDQCPAHAGKTIGPVVQPASTAVGA